MRPLLYVMLLMLVIVAPAQAEIFTWKDENGKTHFGDKVPEKYKDNNTEVDVGAVNSSVPEKTQKKHYDKRTQYPLENNPPALPPIDKPGAKAPKTCAEKKAAYEQSKACFEQCRLYQYDRYGNRKPSGMNSVCAAQNGCKNMKKPDC